MLKSKLYVVRFFEYIVLFVKFRRSLRLYGIFLYYDVKISNEIIKRY